ncbi:MAG: putative sulfate exporter family transporter [Anaerolineaceae bacterium]|nr:putative sulfate exporter family transporter [Anaerolineaceae bacterium]
MTQQETQSRKWARLLIGLVMLVLLVVLVAELDKWISASFKAQGMSKNPLEYPLTAVVIGLLANGILRLAHLYDFVRPAIRTELFLKIGLVLLGARISLGDLLAKGAGGLVQALVMVASVFLFTWWLAGRFKLPETLKAVMASAVSVCGVSAAIAAAGAVQARKEEVSYITTLVILTALPLMVLMPWLANVMGLTPTIAGAWFGGNIDTTAAVVGAGTIYGPEAQQVAAVVKLAQNVLIGFVAFALALYFALVVNRGEGERPTPAMIWQRFPKFVLGFVLVSILASLDVFTPALAAEIDTANKWFFALAFVCIGLDFTVAELRKAGWKPIGVYLGATVFNTVLALIVATVIFGVLGLGA